MPSRSQVHCSHSDGCGREGAVNRARGLSVTPLQALAAMGTGIKMKLAVTHNSVRHAQDSIHSDYGSCTVKRVFHVFQKGQESVASLCC